MPGYGDVQPVSESFLVLHHLTWVSHLTNYIAIIPRPPWMPQFRNNQHLHLIRVCSLFMLFCLILQAHSWQGLPALSGQGAR
jgi:hypothetical protein